MPVAPSSPVLSLARFVEDVRVSEPATDGSMDVESIPDGRTSLIIRVRNDGGDVTVAGPRTRARFKHTTGISRAIVFKLKPGWSASLLGVDGSALTDRTVPLEDVWGRSSRELCDRLIAAPGLPQILEQLSVAIGQRTHHEPASARLARRAVRLIEAGEDRVEAVALRLGVTGRHLRRAFAESIGIGPKDFVRTVRLQRVVRQAAPGANWARIATDAGYYDQAHLIGDFRDLVGVTPTAFRSRVETKNAEPLRRDSASG